MYRKPIGSKLPKNINDNLKDINQELKTKIEILYQNFQRNIISGLWTQQDYKQLRSELGKLDESTFVEAFSFILKTTDFNNQQIKDYYLKIDQDFKLYIYENKKEPNIKDIVTIVKQLASKKLQLENIILNNYHNNLLEKKDLQDQIIDLKLLLEKLNNNDEDIIKLIEKEYQNFINPAVNYPGLLEFLEIPIDCLINLNKIKINQKIKYYYLSLNSYKEIDDYKLARMYRG